MHCILAFITSYSKVEIFNSVGASDALQVLFEVFEKSVSIFAVALNLISKLVDFLKVVVLFRFLVNFISDQV
jgi:hypothetical protein